MIYTANWLSFTQTFEALDSPRGVTTAAGFASIDVSGRDAVVSWRLCMASVSCPQTLLRTLEGRGEIQHLPR